MELAHYFSQQDGTVSFSEEQASAFAKGVAGDFNPIHDPGGKRFCVPGDLLFCVLLHRYGVAQVTAVQFSGMLDGQTRMQLPDTVEASAHIVDVQQRALLSLFLDGERFTDSHFVNALSLAYVQFSGQTFPDILVPLMQGANVMINPDRPLVIYKDMAIELNKDLTSLQGGGVSLQAADNDISVNGRKGAVNLKFTIRQNDECIGRGEKNMVLSGLREYDAAAMQEIVERYDQWRKDYKYSDKETDEAIDKEIDA